ncbi:MAG: DUF1127 domain-containing protein [Alphaproteobacteria bacterium]|nr:DUF1127 domain-containing protein [Alphaproteobacteria bacterium]TAD89393.1 MAG: DUF1127 domain-containing protein [Alphaproteobacteria bacterium]
MIAKLRTAMAVRRAEAELMALDDRLLADIGIQRAEIHTALAAANANTRPHRAA